MQLTPLFLKITEELSMTGESPLPTVSSTTNSNSLPQNVLKNMKKKNQKPQKLNKLQKNQILQRIQQLDRPFQQNNFRKSYRDKRILNRKCCTYGVPGYANSKAVKQMLQPNCVQFLYYNSQIQDKYTTKDDKTVYIYQQPQQNESVLFKSDDEIISEQNNNLNLKLYQEIVGRYIQYDQQQFPSINLNECNPYMQVALIFSQIATYVQQNKNQELDLLNLTLEVVDEAIKLIDLSEEQKNTLTNSILIALTSIKVKSEQIDGSTTRL